MAIDVNGKSIETDEEGYLSNLNDWETDVATVMAKEDDIELGEDHWEIINFLREYYEEYQIAPAVRVLTKAVGKKLGKDKVHEFRRSWDIKPDPLSKKSPYHPINIEIYKGIPKEIIPDTESLKDTYERVLKYFKNEIEDKLKNGNILISAHGNSIRALCKYLFNLDNSKISELEIPTGNPLIIDLNENFEIKNCEYLDKDRAKDLLIF